MDDLLRHPDDQPTIGLLLCRKKNKLVAEYALRGLDQSIAVAEWQTRLTESLPEIPARQPAQRSRKSKPNWLTKSDQQNQAREVNRESPTFHHFTHVLFQQTRLGGKSPV